MFVVFIIDTACGVVFIIDTAKFKLTLNPKIQYFGAHEQQPNIAKFVISLEIKNNLCRLRSLVKMTLVIVGSLSYEYSH